jgi:hypothetical protein
LVNVPFAQNKLLTNQTGIWSIALNVLVNQFECSIVRSQACAFLINLTSSLVNSTLTETEEYNVNFKLNLDLANYFINKMFFKKKKRIMTICL